MPVAQTYFYIYSKNAIFTCDSSYYSDEIRYSLLYPLVFITLNLTCN